MVPPPTSPADAREQESRRPTPPPAPTTSDPLLSSSYLSSPVPNLAATLSPYTFDEADEANVRFLRASLDPLNQVSRQQDDQTAPNADSRSDHRRATTSQHPQAADEYWQALLRTSQESVDDPSRRERLQRVLARLNRLHDQTSNFSSVSAYSNRTPSPSRQRLYDWAPSHEEAVQQEESDLDHILAELRQQQPDTHPDILRVLSQSQLDPSRQRARDSIAQSHDTTDTASRRDRLRERRRRENDWVSLRSRAVLQRARQESSPSATERMLRYVMDRERSGMSEEEERARGTGWFISGASRSNGEQNPGGITSSSREPWPLPPSASELRARTLQERADVMQRRYMAENAPTRLPRVSTPPVPATVSPSTSSSVFLESALKYLNQLRSSHRYEEALSAAIEHGLATKEFFADKHDDFVMNLEEMNPLAGSSWLQSGTVFDGHQHAVNGNPGLLQSTPASAPSHAVEQINPNFRNQGAASAGFDHPPGSTRILPFDATRPWLSHRFAPPFHSAEALTAKAPDPCHDHWPVRVTLHSVDAERMTLQGTMEAYDVPQHPANLPILNSNERPKAGKKHAPITTYLEGHIIDLSTHSFLTPGAATTKMTGPHATSAHNSSPYTTLSDDISFPSANAHTDASNWRKLPPFSQFPSDDETARCLLSQARMNEIHEEYIFMRWKERCFVHSKDDKCSEADRRGDQDRGHGLTISGFYYVSLRRRDGTVDGLYFDPTSTPYQHLRLKGHRTGWPAFEFR